MKKIILAAIMLLSLSTTQAQVVNSDDLNGYNGEELVLNDDGIDYIESAIKIMDMYGLDKNNAITRTTIVNASAKMKEQIYIEVNNWFIHSFNSGKSVIQLNEKEAGAVIAKGFIPNVAQHVSFTSSADIHAWVIIRVDIKDFRFKITTTIQEYEMEMGTGIIGAMNTGLNGTPDTKTRMTWQPKDCFPFVGKRYKKTTSKAFVNCHIWSQIVTNKLSESVLNGITGTENDW